MQSIDVSRYRSSSHARVRAIGVRVIEFTVLIRASCDERKLILSKMNLISKGMAAEVVLDILTL